MNRREKLIVSAMSDVNNPTEARVLDTTVKIVLADMGKQFCEFWRHKGPGVLFLNPSDSEPSFYKTLDELEDARETCDRNNDHDLSESFLRIQKAAEKIKPDEKAAYVILDDEGMRYLEIDYNKVQDGDS